MRFNLLIIFDFLFFNKNLVSALLARFAYGLDVRIIQSLILTLLMT